MSTVYYLKSAELLIEGQKEGVDKVVAQLLAGHTKSANLKQIKRAPHGLLRAKLNDKWRLFLTVIDGKCYLLHITPHNYEKDLPTAVRALETLKTKNTTELFQPYLLSNEFKSTTEDSWTENPVIEPVSVFGGKELELNSTQKKVVKEKSSRILYGLAGTGKTSTALLTMVEEILNPTNQNNKPCLFVTPTQTLVTQTAHSWRDIALLNGLPLGKIEFQTVYEKLKELFKKFPSYSILSPTDVKGAWEAFTQMNTIQEQLSLVIPHRKSQYGTALAALNDVYQELTLIAYWNGYGSDKAPCITPKQSYFNLSAPNIKDTLLGLLNQYRQFLGKNRVDPDISQFPPDILPKKVCYSIVGVDEAQNVSINVLALLAKLGTVCIPLMDPNQNTKSPRSDLSIKQSLLKQIKPTQEIPDPIRLEEPYRCPESVEEISQKILRMRDLLSNVSPEAHYRNPARPQGKVSLHPKNFADPTIVDLLKKKMRDYKSTDFCIITEGNKADVLRHFPEDPEDPYSYQPLVCHPREIAGLDIPCVIVYQPLGESRTSPFKAANDAWKALEARAQTKKSAVAHNLKKENAIQDTRYFESFNKLYATLTRATNELIVIQTKAPWNDDLLTEWEKSFPTQPENTITPEKSETSAQKEPVIEKADENHWENRLLSMLHQEEPHFDYIKELAEKYLTTRLIDFLEEFERVKPPRHPPAQNIGPHEKAMDTLPQTQEAPTAEEQADQVEETIRARLEKLENELMAFDQEKQEKKEIPHDYVNELITITKILIQHDIHSIELYQEIMFIFRGIVSTPEDLSQVFELFKIIDSRYLMSREPQPLVAYDHSYRENNRENHCVSLLMLYMSFLETCQSIEMGLGASEKAIYVYKALKKNYTHGPLQKSGTQFREKYYVLVCKIFERELFYYIDPKKTAVREKNGNPQLIHKILNFIKENAIEPNWPSQETEAIFESYRAIFINAVSQIFTKKKFNWKDFMCLLGDDHSAPVLTPTRTLNNIRSLEKYMVLFVQQLIVFEPNKTLEDCQLVDEIIERLYILRTNNNILLEPSDFDRQAEFWEIFKQQLRQFQFSYPEHAEEAKKIDKKIVKLTQQSVLDISKKRLNNIQEALFQSQNTQENNLQTFFTEIVVIAEALIKSQCYSPQIYSQIMHMFTLTVKTDAHVSTLFELFVSMHEYHETFIEKHRNVMDEDLTHIISCYTSFLAVCLQAEASPRLSDEVILFYEEIDRIYQLINKKTLKFQDFRDKFYGNVCTILRRELEAQKTEASCYNMELTKLILVFINQTTIKPHWLDEEKEKILEKYRFIFIDAASSISFFVKHLIESNEKTVENFTVIADLMNHLFIARKNNNVPIRQEQWKIEKKTLQDFDQYLKDLEKYNKEYVEKGAVLFSDLEEYNKKYIQIGSEQRSVFIKEIQKIQKRLKILENLYENMCPQENKALTSTAPNAAFFKTQHTEPTQKATECIEEKLTYEY